MEKEKEKEVVVLGGTEYRVSELLPRDLVIDEADGKGSYFKTYARVWFYEGEPIIAEPYREDETGARWYYSRELDFGI